MVVDVNTPVGEGREITMAATIRLVLNPTIPPPQLHAFYVKNNVCEAGYGVEAAARPLCHAAVVVAVYCRDELIALARASFDGLAASIDEFCVATAWQGPDLVYGNGSLIEKDEFGVGQRVGEMLLAELERMGADFVSTNCLEGVEEEFYRGLGLRLNPGSVEYVIDRRPYVD